MSDDEFYEEFLDIMFTEFTADEMGYMHVTVMEED